MLDTEVTTFAESAFNGLKAQFDAITRSRGDAKPAYAEVEVLQEMDIKELAQAMASIRDRFDAEGNIHLIYESSFTLVEDKVMLVIERTSVFPE